MAALTVFAVLRDVRFLLPDAHPTRHQVAADLEAQPILPRTSHKTVTLMSVLGLRVCRGNHHFWNHANDNKEQRLQAHSFLPKPSCC